MRLNKIIIILISADLLLYGAWGLIAPIYAIFITEQIRNGSIEIIGLLVATFWIVKSIIQPFLANFLDIKKGEKDDFLFLVIGTIIASFVPLGYFFAKTIFDVFFLEILRAIAMALIVPSWFGIFSRHINKNWYAFSWSVHSTTLGIAIGFSALFGSIIASMLGFKYLFILVSFFTFCSVIMLFYIRKTISITNNSQDSTLLSHEDFKL